MMHADEFNKNASRRKRNTEPSLNADIRVGKDYQAVIPELQPEDQRNPDILPDRALLVWYPTEEIEQTELEDYIINAQKVYGYNQEQALGMLLCHQHDLERAILDLENYTLTSREWSEAEKLVFEQAFHLYGKNFHRIRKMLPDKTTTSIVEYYYHWKKTRSCSSSKDKNAMILKGSRRRRTKFKMVT